MSSVFSENKIGKDFNGCLTISLNKVMESPGEIKEFHTILKVLFFCYSEQCSELLAER